MTGYTGIRLLTVSFPREGKSGVWVCSLSHDMASLFCVSSKRNNQSHGSVIREKQTKTDSNRLGTDSCTNSTEWL